RRLEQSAGAIDDGDLDAGSYPGVESHRDALPGRCGEQEIVEVAAEDADRLELGLLAETLLGVGLEAGENLSPPPPVHSLPSPRHVMCTVCASHRSAGRPLFSILACAAMRRSGSVGAAAPSSGRSIDRRRNPSFRPRSRASTRCDGTFFTRSVALK